MPFAYYSRLPRGAQAVYRQSDAVLELPLSNGRGLWPITEELRLALLADDRPRVEAACARLQLALTGMLGVEPVRVEVLAVRPSLRTSELHGLYTREPGRTPRIQVWMRTARQKRVVAFRTFLRTLLHELVHHFDYTHLKLADSFHTEGFFKRESSLFKQIVPAGKEE
jgi:hypothetical protein